MKWHEFGCDELSLMDDKNYLVVWEDERGIKSTPITAYWLEQQNAFFPCHGDIAWPLRVDYYCEIPDFENKKEEIPQEWEDLDLQKMQSIIENIKRLGKKYR